MDKTILEWLDENNLLNKDKLITKYGETDVLTAVSNDFTRSEAEYKRRKDLFIKHGWIISLLDISNEDEKYKIASYIENQVMRENELFVLSDFFKRVPVLQIGEFMNSSQTLSLSLKILKKLMGNYNIVDAPTFVIGDTRFQIKDFELSFTDISSDILKKGLKDNKELENFIVDEVYKFFSNKTNLYIYVVIQEVSLNIKDNRLLVRTRVNFDKEN